MKVTVLFENTTKHPSFVSGHGLSLYIETEKHKILFDTGANQYFSHNARAMGIDLAEVDLAVISHGHYDHGGGLSAFLEINKTAPVYISPLAFDCFYSGYEKYIGLDPQLVRSRFNVVDKALEIDEGILLTSEQFDTRDGMQNGGMYIKRNGEYIPDMFLHEQYLIITENGKKTVFSGCSHRGIVNIQKAFCPHVLIGGFHFSKLDPWDEYVLKTADMLSKTSTVFYTCHCTGVAQYNEMKKKMPGIFYIGTGDSFVI